MKTTPNATRYIQRVLKITPTEKVSNKKISQPGEYNKKILEDTKNIYTGRGTL